MLSFKMFGKSVINDNNNNSVVTAVNNNGIISCLGAVWTNVVSGFVKLKARFKMGDNSGLEIRMMAELDVIYGRLQAIGGYVENDNSDEALNISLLNLTSLKKMLKKIDKRIVSSEIYMDSPVHSRRDVVGGVADNIYERLTRVSVAQSSGADG